VEGNDPQRGKGQVCEGDGVRVGVSYGMIKFILLFFRWLSPFLKLVLKGFPRFAKGQVFIPIRL
jgi:hypothetical protein